MSSLPSFSSFRPYGKIDVYITQSLTLTDFETHIDPAFPEFLGGGGGLLYRNLSDSRFTGYSLNTIVWRVFDRPYLLDCWYDQNSPTLAETEFYNAVLGALSLSQEYQVREQAGAPVLTKTDGSVVNIPAQLDPLEQFGVYLGNGLRFRGLTREQCIGTKRRIVELMGGRPKPFTRLTFTCEYDNWEKGRRWIMEHWSDHRPFEMVAFLRPDRELTLGDFEQITEPDVMVPLGLIDIKGAPATVHVEALTEPDGWRLVFNCEEPVKPERAAVIRQKLAEIVKCPDLFEDGVII